jgi:hypothetical protein
LTTGGVTGVAGVVTAGVCLALSAFLSTGGFLLLQPDDKPSRIAKSKKLNIRIIIPHIN